MEKLLQNWNVDHFISPFVKNICESMLISNFVAGQEDSFPLPPDGVASFNLSTFDAFGRPRFLFDRDVARSFAFCVPVASRSCPVSENPYC